MGKYEPLAQKLKDLTVDRWEAEFTEIEQVLGFALPPTAAKNPTWWSNSREGHAQSQAWLDAGWKTEKVDVNGRKVTFQRSEERPIPSERSRPALFGVAKGTIRVAPGTDLTAPIDVRWAVLEDG